MTIPLNIVCYSDESKILFYLFLYSTAQETSSESDSEVIIMSRHSAEFNAADTLVSATFVVSHILSSV